MPFASEIPPKNIPDFTEVHDISAPLGTVAAYPGDRQYSREWMSRLEDGGDFSLSALALSSHAGTHLDAPAHLLKSGRTLDQYPLKRFILPAQVISVDDKSVEESIQASALQNLKINPGEALLFRTGNSSRGLLRRPAFSEEFVYLSVDAARLCVALGISLVGIDCLSVDRYGDASAPVHRCLLENDVLILEGIDLEAVSPGRYLLICPPLRIKDAEAAPARAVLVR
jgi:arylformamidase